MNERLAYFESAGDKFIPLPFSASVWSKDMLNGTSVCAIAARALENAHTAEGFLPARLTVDLLRPARTTPLTTTTTSVREGSRIREADAEIRQDGETVARASCVFLQRSSQPTGEVWTRAQAPLPPPATLVPPSAEPAPPWFGSDDHPVGWSTKMEEHQGASRKRMWQHHIAAVEGEDPSPFVRAAMAGEVTSLITNWGTAGVGFINTDLTLVLSRLPEGPEIGIEADNHISADGISVGSATLFDRRGAVGTCVVSALANVRRQVDFTS
jgi:hypothetical protein